MCDALGNRSGRLLGPSDPSKMNNSLSLLRLLKKTSLALKHVFKTRFSRPCDFDNCFTFWACLVSAMRSEIARVASWAPPGPPSVMQRCSAFPHWCPFWAIGTFRASKCHSRFNAVDFFENLHRVEARVIFLPCGNQNSLDLVLPMRFLKYLFDS